MFKSDIKIYVCTRKPTPLAMKLGELTVNVALFAVPKELALSVQLITVFDLPAPWNAM
mgnify:CR=1 FL=1